MKATNVLLIDNIVLSNGCRFVADLNLDHPVARMGVTNTGWDVDALRKMLTSSLESLRVDYSNIDEANRGSSWCNVRKA